MGRASSLTREAWLSAKVFGLLISLFQVGWSAQIHLSFSANGLKTYFSRANCKIRMVAPAMKGPGQTGNSPKELATLKAPSFMRATGVRTNHMATALNTTIRAT